MLAARLGGVVYSRTQATLDYYGVSEVSAIARDNGGVRINQSIMDAGDLIEAHSWYNQGLYQEVFHNSILMMRRTSVCRRLPLVTLSRASGGGCNGYRPLHCWT